MQKSPEIGAFRSEEDRVLSAGALFYFIVELFVVRAKRTSRTHNTHRCMVFWAPKSRATNTMEDHYNTDAALRLMNLDSCLRPDRKSSLLTT